MFNEPTILIVPGLRDPVAQHWQTLLEAEWPRAAALIEQVAAPAAASFRAEPRPFACTGPAAPSSRQPITPNGGRVL